MSKQENNVHCAICGKGYYLCLACKSNKLTPWKLHTDTSEHYKIYQILHGVNSGVYTKEEAKYKLERVDLSDFDELVERVQIQIKDIIDSENDLKDKRRNKKVKPLQNRNKETLRQ